MKNNGWHKTPGKSLAQQLHNQTQTEAEKIIFDLFSRHNLYLS